MGVLDSLAGDVEAGLGQLHSALDQVARLGGVTDLAGHPRGAPDNTGDA